MRYMLYLAGRGRLHKAAIRALHMTIALGCIGHSHVRIEAVTAIGFPGLFLGWGGGTISMSIGP